MTLPPPTLNELYQLERIRQARLLPKAAGAVFVVTRVVDDVEKYDVRTVALDGSHPRTVARDLESIGALAPSPDGEVWACMAPFNGKPQIAFMDPGTGALRAVTSLPQGVGGPPVWSPCGRWLAFTAVGEERVAKGPFDTTRTSSLFYKLDGAGFAQRVAQDIFVASREWCEVRRLTHGPASHGGLAWSPVAGRTELCFTTHLEPDGLDPTQSAGLIDLEGQVRWVRRHTRNQIYAFGWAGDGERWLLTCTPPGKPFGAPAVLFSGRVGEVEGEGAAGVARTEAFTRETGGQAVNMVLSTQMLLGLRQPLSAPGDDHAFVCTERAGRSAVARVALSGDESCVPVTPAEGDHVLIDVHATHLLTAAIGYNAPPDLWVSGHDGRGRTRLTALNDGYLATRAWPEIHEMNFTASDGTPLQAWLLRPAGAAGPQPMFLDIHGGPQCAWGPSWHLGAQMLAGAGIATLFPNPRGSSGYGEKHVAAIFGSFVQPADTDLLAAVDEAVRLGLADPDRLAVGGVSYGGIASAWLLGRTGRFKCAIPEQMIANLVSFYGESDLGRSLVANNFGVTLKEGRELLWRNSPLAHAHKATTPTLIIQCENDERCPMGEAEQFFVALKEAGCTVEFMRMPGSHAAPLIGGVTRLSRPRDEAVLDWLTRYLRH